VTSPPGKSTSQNQCEFSPEILNHELIHVSTNCFVGFTLRTKGLRQQAERKLADLNGPSTETAASFDGRRYVYTVRTSSGTSIMYAGSTTDTPTLIHRIEGEAGLIQPSFICPRDVMYKSMGSVWVLNTDTAQVVRIGGIDVTRDGGQ